MNARVVLSATRGHNAVNLVELYSGSPGYASVPTVFVVVLVVQDRAQKSQTWARTDLDPLVARELYDVAVAEFITSEAL